MIYEGATTQRDICEQLSLSRQTVNSAFRQLVKKDLVTLTPVQGNLRTKQVLLTKAGVEFVEQYVGTMHRLEERVWNTMQVQERADLVRLLCKYRDLLHGALAPHQQTE